ncbi:MAG: Flp family type IVb pilin [Alphaproteobacteria bacterium]|nr:MAG: Flp family type IVb pilin [Alphaproteobacteria bacterium]
MKRMIDGTDRISLPRQFLRGERGTTAIEYSIVAAGIAMAVVGAIRVLGANVLTDLFSQLGSLFG